jgi:hypothetical protein
MKALGILLAGLAVLLGVGLWVGAIGMLVEHELFLLNNVEGVAEVVDLKKSVAGPGSRNPDAVYFTPVLRFTAKSGKAVEFGTEWSSNPPMFELGEQVPIVYSAANPDDVRVAKRGWSSVLMFCVGALFLFLGGRSFYVRHRNKQLLREGTPIRTTFFRVTLNPAVSVNDAHPWLIVTQWRNPRTRAKRFYQSENLWFDPTPHLSDDPILVYVDPKRPGHYVMEVSSIIGRKRPLSGAASESSTRVLTTEEEARVLDGTLDDRHDHTSEAQPAGGYLLDGLDFELCLDSPAATSPAHVSPKDALKEARGSRMFVHFNRREASGAAVVKHPTHAVLLIETDFRDIKIGAKRLSCTLQGGKKCAVPWEAIFAIVVPSARRGLVWPRSAPADACFTDRSHAALAGDLAVAHQLPALTVNGKDIPNGQFELLVDGEWFPGITIVEWRGTLGPFFKRLRLGGSTEPLLDYVRARLRAEKRPKFFVELGYETKSMTGRAAFTGCTWVNEATDTLDTLTFRPSSFQWTKVFGGLSTRSWSA